MTIVLNGTTGISGVDGSAATPAVQGADTNTGVFYPAADTVGVSTNGSERMRIDSSGNVGIGTTSPSKQLYVYTAANSLQIQSVVRNSNTGTGVAAIGFNVADASEGDYTQAGIGLVRGIANGSGALCFYNKGSGSASNFTTADEKMRIDSSGNVGIGQSSITQAFTNYTQLNISGSSGATIQMQSGATSRANLVADGNALYIAGLSGAIAFGVNGTGTGTEVGRFGSTGLFQFNSGYGSVATAYGCRAWVNFNGVTTATIQASGNVTSVTRSATGNYTVNFTTAMPDANYACTGTCEGNGETISVSTKTGRTTSAMPLIVVRMSGGANVQSDNASINVAVLR